MIQKFNNVIYNIFLLEKENFFSWLPIFLSIGICIQPFTVKLIPLEIIIAAVIVFTYAAFKNKSKPFIFTVCLMITALLSGIALISLRVNHVESFIVRKKTFVKDMSAKVEEITMNLRGKLYIIKDIQSPVLSEDKTPAKARIRIYKNNENIEEGDLISLNAIFLPPPKRVTPEGYSFAEYAFFKQIGAVGYSVSDVKIIKKHKFNFSEFVNHIRSFISQRIFQIKNKDSAAIISALLIGEKGNISEKNLKAMRNSGIAHLLAISGMHMTLVAGFFFISLRSVLACINNIVLKYNSKKIAAYISIIGSFIYLLISGSPISAQRAFIMIFLMLFSIIVDRFSNPIRTISIAAIIIILISPESIFTASFQMSFFAALALISFFIRARNKDKYQKNIKNTKIINKIFSYIIGIAISSTVAGVATMPFSIFHFNNYANYGAITNLIAIPLTALYIMPLGIISLLLMPLGIERPFLELMSYGVSIIVKIATCITDLPNASIKLFHMPSYILIIFIFSFLWLCIFQTRIRFVAILPIMLAILLFINSTKNLPDLIIDNEGKLFAIRNDNNEYDFSVIKSKKYIRNNWLRYLNRSNYNLIENNNYNNKSYLCNESGCTIYKNNYKISVNKLAFMLDYDCRASDMVINLSFINPKECKLGKYYIDVRKLKKFGPYFIYIEKNAIKIKTSNK